MVDQKKGQDTEREESQSQQGEEQTPKSANPPKNKERYELRRDFHPWKFLCLVIAVAGRFLNGLVDPDWVLTCLKRLLRKEDSDLRAARAARQQIQKRHNNENLACVYEVTGAAQDLSFAKRWSRTGEAQVGLMVAYARRGKITLAKKIASRFLDVSLHPFGAICIATKGKFCLSEALSEAEADLCTRNKPEAYISLLPFLSRSGIDLKINRIRECISGMPEDWQNITRPWLVRHLAQCAKLSCTIEPSRAQEVIDEIADPATKVTAVLNRWEVTLYPVDQLAFTEFSEQVIKRQNIDVAQSVWERATLASVQQELGTGKIEKAWEYTGFLRDPVYMLRAYALLFAHTNDALYLDRAFLRIATMAAMTPPVYSSEVIDQARLDLLLAVATKANTSELRKLAMAIDCPMRRQSAYLAIYQQRIKNAAKTRASVAQA